MILLHQRGKPQLYVSPAHISALIPHRDGGSYVFVAGCPTFEVRETPEEILKLLREGDHIT